MTPNIDARNGCYGGTTITDLEHSVIRAEERAKLFRESIVKFVPEFAHLIKQDGDPNHAPHNCINELSAQLVCGICGAKYVEHP